MHGISGPVSLAFPYIGEFGWEIMHWQSYLRAASRSGQRIAVSSRPESRALYDDFCVTFHPHDIRATHSIFCTSTDSSEKEKANQLADDLCARHGYDRILFPVDIFSAGHKHAFIPLSQGSHQYVYDVIVHARSHHHQCFRNYRYDLWAKVISLLNGYRIATLASDSVYDLSKLGVTSIPAASVSEAAAALSSSRLFIGPDSGSLHLAALTETSRVTWLRDLPLPHFKTRLERIMKTWNPFGTATYIVSDSSYQPDPEAVAGLTIRELQRGAGPWTTLG